MRSVVVVTFFTVMVADADLPFEDVALMVAVPSDLPVTVPLDTVATAVLLDDHVTVGSVAFEGATVAVSLTDEPTFTEAEVLSRVTEVTSTVVTFSIVFL